jgi:hypothetical protein
MQQPSKRALARTTGSSRADMSGLKKLALKIVKFEGPPATLHHHNATDVMLQAYFQSEELIGAYTSPGDDVAVAYISAEKSFYVDVPEALLEAYLDKYGADLTEPGQSDKHLEVTCGNGAVTYQLSPYEPYEAARGRKRIEDEDLWGFLRGEKTRTYHIEAIAAAIVEPFRRAGIDATDAIIAPQRNRADGGITVIASSFTVNGLAPLSAHGYYLTDEWTAVLQNIPIGNGYMSFECSRALASRLDVCTQCLRYTTVCPGHGKGVKRRATTDTPQEMRAREMKARMDHLKRLKARKSAAGSSSSHNMEQ